MKKVGQLLKAERLKQKLTLEQAALVTKISKTNLKAIEEANEKKLPSKSYLRGFVASYGRYLKVDAEELMTIFAEEVGSTNPKTQIDVIQKDTWKTIPFINKIQFNSKTLIVTGLVVVTALALFTKNVIKKYQNEAITLPVIQQEAHLVLPSQDNPTKSNAKNADNKEESKVIANAQPKTTLDNKEIVNDNIKEPTSDKKENAEAALVAKNTYGSNAEQLKELIIEAKSDSQINIKIGDEDVRKIHLKQGDFHTIKAKSKILFETENADAVNVIFNGILQTNLNKNNKKVERTY